MGIFSRNKDEEVYMDPQPTDQVAPVASPPAAPSVDGVLPPGVSPTPAPPSNNLASQVAPNASAIHTTAVPAPQPANDMPTEDTAGDYIMTAPPLQQQADEWSEPDQETPTAETTEPLPETKPAAHVEVETPQPESQDSVSEAAEQPQAESAPQATGPADSSVDLADIKQQALQQLSPLVAHLEQSPEERFHTTMMLLQSTDDKNLIKPAYEAAQSITDEKTRAQALLDIVNEINYLNQKP